MATTTRTRAMPGRTAGRQRTRSHNALEPDCRVLPIRAHFAAGNCRHSAFSARAPGRAAGAPGPIERLRHWARRRRRPVGRVVGYQSRSLPWPRRIPGSGPHRPSGAPGVRRAIRKSARGTSLPGWLRLRRCRRRSAPARRPLQAASRRAVRWGAQLPRLALRILGPFGAGLALFAAGVLAIFLLAGSDFQTFCNDVRALLEATWRAISALIVAAAAIETKIRRFGASLRSPR